MVVSGIKEGVKVRDHESTMDRRKTFAKRKFAVTSYNCIVQPGTYVFPFRMPVDPARPATMKSVTLKVDYKLKAQVIGPDFLTAPVKHTIPIELLLAVSMPIVPSQMYKEQMTSTCLCYNQKNLKCTVILDKSAYIPGENIYIVVMVDASQLTNIIAVDLRMIQSIKNNRAPLHAPTQFIHQTASMPSVQAGKKTQNCVMLPIPLYANHSALCGIFLKWHFFISVILNVNCGGYFEIHVPFTIYKPPLLEPLPPIVLPDDSNTQVNNLVLLEPSKVIYPY